MLRAGIKSESLVRINKDLIRKFLRYKLRYRLFIKWKVGMKHLQQVRKTALNIVLQGADMKIEKLDLGEDKMLNCRTHMYDDVCKDLRKQRVYVKSAMKRIL